MRSEEIEKQIEEYVGRTMLEVDISVICRKNVRELRIKQVELPELNLKVKLTIDK